MSVKIRLARHGRKKKPMYSIVVADSRSKRDGRYIEKLGTYNPNTNPATIDLNDEKAFDWVMKGAQPTDTVKAMLSYRGVMLKKHLQIGVNKGAIAQADADKKLEAWKVEKDSKIAAKGDSVMKAAADIKAKAFEAEKKKNEAREEVIRQRLAEAEAASVVVEEVAEVSEATETPAEEAPVAEAPAAEAEKTEAPAEAAPAAEEKKED